MSSWLTSEETAKRLGVKYRTLLDIVKKGQLRPEKVARAGVAGGPVSMFDPAQVEALAEQRAAVRTEVIPAGDTGISAVMQTSVQAAGNHLNKTRLLAAVAGREQFLTVEEAAVYIGLPCAELDRLVKSGELPGRKAGRWYIRRRDLDKL